MRKNSHEVIRVITLIIQRNRRYCQYNNEGADEIFPLFPAFLCYWELLWQHFLPVLLKLQLYQSGSNIPSPSCRRSRTEILWARGPLPHASHTAQYISVYAIFENKRSIFTKV
jgi:hypothetical protein